MEATVVTERTMQAYADAWEAKDLERLVASCHLPYLVLRSGVPVVRSTQAELREAFAKLLPMWSKDGPESDRFEALPPLSQDPTTVVVRVRWGAWTLNAPGAAPQPSPTLFYVVCRVNGRWGVSQAIAEWPR